jgi:hypothetical protein
MHPSFVRTQNIPVVRFAALTIVGIYCKPLDFPPVNHGIAFLTMSRRARREHPVSRYVARLPRLQQYDLNVTCARLHPPRQAEQKVRSPQVTNCDDRRVPRSNRGRHGLGYGSTSR